MVPACSSSWGARSRNCCSRNSARSRPNSPIASSPSSRSASGRRGRESPSGSAASLPAHSARFASNGHCPPASGDALLSALDRHFLEDVAVLRALLGSFEQVTAQRHLAPNGELVSAVTTLGGPNLPLVLWSAQPGQQAGFQLVAVAGEDEVRLHAQGDQCRWHPPGQPAQAWPIDQLADRAAHRLLFEGCPSPSPSPAIPATSHPPPASANTPAGSTRVFPRATWDDLLRGVELQAVVHESIRRRRTVDVLFERPSERGQFKSKMAAAGCGLLLWTPIAMVLYLVVAATLPLSRFAQLLLVLAVFAPLGLFLGLQSLLVLTRPAADESTDRSP